MKILKGSMVAPHCKPEDLTSLLQAGAKLVRYQMVVPENLGHKEWVDYLYTHTYHITYTVIPLVSEYGAKVIIDMHTPHKNHFRKGGQLAARTWKEIALKFKNEWSVLGYDLLNEPRAAANAVRTYMDTCYKMIRSVDKRKHIFISSPYGNPEKPFGQAYFSNYKDKKIVYTAHMYDPLNLTHFGVNNTDINNAKYPNTTGHRAWDKDRMYKVLRKLRKLQTSKKVQVYIGEFSCSNFVGEIYREQYIRDLLDIFKEYGWAWTYHAYMEADVWHPQGKVWELLKKEWANA